MLRTVCGEQMKGPDERDVVVRGFGYDITHAARIPAQAVEAMEWITPFTGIRTPIVGRCRKRVRSVQKAVVVMQPETEVSCEVCKAVLEMMDQTS